MPARVAAARSSQSSAPSSKSRASASTRNASPPDQPDEGPETSLRTQICAVFGDAQKSNNGQRKLVVRLRKIQEACCYEPAEPRSNASHDDFDESDFNAEITRCLLRLLPIKKSEPAGDRILRFLGVFLKQATDLDNAIFQQHQDQDPEAAQSFPETPSSRLTSSIISVVLPILPSKDKVVRFRATQVIAHLINTLDSVDEELFYHIRLGLLKRLRDKESNVRVQAVYGLGRLASESPAEDAEDDSDDDTSGGVVEKLLDALQNDPSSDVRRSLLLNLPFTPSTLPFLLERARDVDAGIRRALYSRLLPALGDFRHLSLTHREKLLRWGLRDRDETVRKATARLFRERWIEDCAKPRDDNGDPIDLNPGQLASPSSEGLLELLERIDVVNAGNDGGIALDAMREFWQGRPDYCDFVTFDEKFWKDLTPESIFIARTFNDFCQSSNDSRLNDKVPEVTRFAFLLQENVNTLVDMVRKSALQEDAEQESAQQEFVVEQLLQIALTLDYSDEIGRRTMFSLMRGALALAELPEEATKLVIEVLRTTCGRNATGERELSCVVLEAIAEVHDNIMGDDAEPPADGMDLDESFHSAKSEVSGESTPKQKIIDPEAEEERAIREIMVNMKCLHIAQCMLQNVECTLEQNPDIVTLLNNLVVPAVRSMEAPIRERGLLCLGLCCLLDMNLATENLELFLKCFSKGHEALQVIAIQIIGDVLNAHPTMLTVPQLAAESIDDNTAIQEQPSLHKDIHKLFSKSLKSASPLVQSTACTTLAKLMLSSPATTSSGNSSRLNHDDLLRHLAIAYFDPDTAGNVGLRQSLSYFLPVYCHSRRENMQRMGRIAMSILHWCYGVKEDMEVDAEGDLSGDMVGLGVVVSHLVDWTDGRRLAAAMAGLGDDASNEAESDVHLDLAVEIIEKILGGCSKDERKLYLSMLSKLYVSPSSDQEKLQTVCDLIKEALDDKIANDATARNALVKVQSTITKAMGSQNNVAQTPSRATSLAASSLHDEDGGPLTLQDESLDSTIIETPVQSPRKSRGVSQRSPSRKSRVPEAIPEVDNVDEGDVTATIVEEMDTLTIDETRAQPSAGTELASLAARPKWQVSELHEQADDAAAEPTEASPEPVPPKSPKRRGRLAKEVVEPTSAAANTTDAVASQPARPRRNVRSSRRQQSLAAADAGEDNAT